MNSPMIGKSKLVFAHLKNEIKSVLSIPAVTVSSLPDL